MSMLWVERALGESDKFGEKRPLCHLEPWRALPTSACLTCTCYAPHKEKDSMSFNVLC